MSITGHQTEQVVSSVPTLHPNMDVAISVGRVGTWTAGPFREVCGFDSDLHGAIMAVTSSDTTTCNLTGKLTFSPALKGLNSGPSTATVSANVSRCFDFSGHKFSIIGGNLQGLVGSASPGNCTSIAIAHVVPALSGGSVTWSQHSNVAASSGVSFPASGATVITNFNGVTFLQVSYSAGSVSGGSFANSGQSSMTVTSKQNDAQLESRCSSRRGVSAVTFDGTATL